MTRLLSLTGLLLALAVLPGCAIKSQLTGLAYGDFRDRVVGIKLYYEDPRGRIRTVTEVGDPSILAFFIKELDRAEPIPPPDRQLPDTYYLSFNVATPEGVRETEPYRYLFQTWNDEPGYLELAGQWVKVSPEFKALLYDLSEYRQATGAIEPGDAAFLRGHGWTPLFKIASRTVRLPAQFLHRAGDFPEAIYWAYNNELNRDLGLDLTPYLGRDVEVNLYKVLEPLPEFMHPRRRAGRAVVVKSGGQIVGAWLDAGRHYGFACSLKGRRLEDITGRTFEEWVAGIIDCEDETERQLAAMPPEEIIRTYFEAASRRDYRLAHACETRAALTGYLFRSMDNNWLYNPSYREDYDLGNIKRAEVLSIGNPVVLARQGETPTALEFAVTVDLRFRRTVTMDSGRHILFVTLKRETERTGWRIAGIGTGP